jgi:dihydroflavonol-4-reductase
LKAIVLGGTGFVGMNVVRALAASGHDVVATRRSRANTLFARKLGARLVQASFEDVPGLAEAMRGRDVVFMCAGHYPRYSLDLDEEVGKARRWTRATLDAARAAGVQRYVLTSSVATVGPAAPGRALSDERDPMSREAAASVYFAVKQAIEQEALDAVRTGLDVVVTCPTGIVGELDVKAGTGFVIVALGNGLLPVYVQGRVNILDADQMAVGHVLAAERGRTGERYILAGHNTTIEDLLRTVCDELGVRFASWRLPLGVAEVLSTLSEMRCATLGGHRRPFIPREFVDMARHGVWVDASKAARELGMPMPVPLADTVRKACRWYERYRYIRPQGTRRSDATAEGRTSVTQGEPT